MIVHVAAVLGFAALCALVLHYFFQYAGHAPYLATDDALVNISYSLSHLGRLGLQHSPLQPYTDTLRTDGYFNSGHWYFFVGAALSWLFGPSLEIQRAIHPFSLIAVAALAMVVFRRDSVAAGAGFGAMLIYVFHFVHWPMVRPDVMVGALAGAAIAATTFAIRTESLGAWCTAAFFAAAAATQHLIAWAIAPAMLVIWVIHALVSHRLDGVERSATPRLSNSFIAAGVGALAALLVFLVAMEFRISELVQFLGGYFEERADPGIYGGYLAVVAKQYRVMWEDGFPAIVRYGVVAGFCGAVLLLLGLPWLPVAERRSAFALLLPPVAMTAAYQLSLGFYANTHAGYAIVAHVIGIWSAAAAAAIVVRLLRHFFFGLRILPELALSLVVLLGMVWEARAIVVKPSVFATLARQWVDIEDYIAATFLPVPEGSTSWGSVTLGLEAGLRVDHVYFMEGLILIHWTKPELRERLAPEFVVLGNYDLNAMAAAYIKEPLYARQPLMTRPIPFEVFGEYFPGLRYELVHTVSAPPYGSTRVYRRFPDSSPPAAVPPSVMVNDGTSAQWGSRLLPEIVAEFKPSATVSFDLPYAQVSFKPTAGEVTGKSQAANLPAGHYLITASLQRDFGTGSGTLIATTTSQFVGQNSEVGHGLVPAPYFPYERTVYVLLTHEGGPLYLSQFDSDPNASFRITKVQPIESFQHVVSSLPLPPLDTWQIVAANPTVVASGADRLEMVGDGSQYGYQLMSPELPVEPNSDITLHLPMEQKAGLVSVGVLDGGGRWLVSPRVETGGIRFNTGRSRHVTVVVANMQVGTTPGPVRFAVGRGEKIVTRVRQSRTYVDELAKCHRTRRHLNPELCLEQPSTPAPSIN